MLVRHTDSFSSKPSSFFSNHLFHHYNIMHLLKNLLEESGVFIRFRMKTAESSVLMMSCCCAGRFCDKNRETKSDKLD